MPTPFLGQIDLFAFNAIPRGWAQCAGQQLPIARNQALFSLLGMAYGGDGFRTFALPDLRGRVPIGSGGGYTVGQQGGQEAVVLTANALPAHNHLLMADASASPTTATPSPQTVLGRSSGRTTPSGSTFSANLYATANSIAALNRAALGEAGGGQPHQNMMPSLALTWCMYIDQHGLYPQRG